MLWLLASFFPIQSEFRAKQISRSRPAIPALYANQFDAACEALNTSWNSPQLSWLVFALLHICRPTLANSENLDGLDPTFFLLNSFRHAFITFLCQYLSSPLADTGVAGSCYPLHTSNAITCPKQRPLNDACSMYKHVRLWTSSPAQSGPLAPWIHFLTLRLHQDIHSTYTVKITSSALRVVSETRKELLLCWLIALSRYFLPAPAVWLHALPRASASSSEKKMSCRSLPTIE